MSLEIKFWEKKSGQVPFLLHNKQCWSTEWL